MGKCDIVMRTRLKFCGIRTVAEALSAADAGADAIGIVQIASARRYVPPDAARKIIAALPPFVVPVLLFANTDPDTVRTSALSVGAKTVQLVGDETPDDVAAMTSALRVIKSIKVEQGHFAGEINQWLAARRELGLANLIALLAESPGTQGGSGKLNNFPEIQTALDALDDASMPLIVAGGLTPTNVASVVTRLRPWAVDVSSGIEKTAGMKDLDLMHHFAAQVALADQTDGDLDAA